MRHRSSALAAVLVLIGTTSTPWVRMQAQTRQALLATPPLEHYLEALRQQTGIPGLSAAVVQEGEVVWEKGFGFQNVESRIRATPDTPYFIGGLSQNFASVLLLQCVEQRRLQLDDPVRRFGIELPEERATLRQVLNHSSTGTPGAEFKLALDRYAQLGTVMEWCAPQPYRKSVAHRLLEHLAMKDSVPGADLKDADAVPEGLFDEAALERYAHVLERVAVPYRVDGKNRPVRSIPPPAEGINAANGIISTVRDLAQFDMALDTTLLLLDETREGAWSPARGVDGTLLPTGLGWFVQYYRDEPVVWQYGHLPNAYSSLIIKLPNRRITLILLANSDGLAATSDLASGDVTKSVFGTLFLRLFL
jgi:CubicO group peptidase (beta-lactamase class C family)